MDEKYGMQMKHVTSLFDPNPFVGKLLFQMVDVGVLAIVMWEREREI